ncbi:MAG: translocation/assembly module TamB domain-containing protein [Thermodesulfovibrionales bacterium]
MEYTRKIKRLWLPAALAVIAIVLAVFLRGPHISNALKRMILPEFEAALGQHVIAQKIYVNLFPLFIEAKGVKVYDEQGKRILLAKRVKAYVDLSGFLQREMRIRRLVLRDLALNTDDAQARKIREHLLAYLSQKKRTDIDVKVVAVEVQNGDAAFDYREFNTRLGIQGFNGEAVFGGAPRYSVRVKEAAVNYHEKLEVRAGISCALSQVGKRIQIDRFEIDSFGSTISGAGSHQEQKTDVAAQGSLMVESFRKIFGLKKPGAGSVSVAGDLKHDGTTLLLDLKVSGSLYIETLMELLGVTERVEGFVEASGRITGPITNVRAEGKATLKNGNLFNVDVERLDCRVGYADGRMSFTEGDGRLYNGRAKASATITLPVVKHYTLSIDFEDVDSPAAFHLIGWDPGIAHGKVRGILRQSDTAFNPDGWFDYRSTTSGANVLERVRTLSGSYRVRGHILELSGIRMATGSSSVSAEGTVDMARRLLHFDAAFVTQDLRDVTMPYYDTIGGAAEFTGKVAGSYDDPEVSGVVTVDQPVVRGYQATALSADFSYRKKLLTVNDLRASANGESDTLKGRIAFPSAKHLFDLGSATFALQGTIQGADAGRVGKFFYPDFRGTGTLAASVKMTGPVAAPNVSADVKVAQGAVYDIAFDNAAFDFAYAKNVATFRNVSVRRGNSLVAGAFTVNPDNTFSYAGSAERLLLSDLIKRPLIGDVTMNLTSSGKGSFDDPEISAEGRILEGVLRGKKVGSGVIKASLKDRRYAIDARLLDEKIRISANGRTDGEMPWELTTNVQTGRYDFLLTSVLRDIPEDLIVNVSGSAHLRGDRRHAAGAVSLRNCVISMYGHTFTNDGEVTVDINDRLIDLHTISLRSGNTVLKVKGSLEAGRSFNLMFEGSSSLSPFKSFLPRLSVFKGDADVLVSLSGDWENPKVNGGITLRNGAIGLKDYSHRVSGIDGYLYLDNDQIVLKNLSGKIGGGDVQFSGVLYLKRFTFKRFYVEAKLTNIGASVSNDFQVNFGGSLLYKGTPAAQNISGDIVINRARYRERIEWKSWLLEAKKQERLKTEISNLEKATLNVRITGKDTIVVDNNVTRATGSADMLLRGTLYRPVVLGRLETSEGTVYFRNNEFRIIRASADFADTKRIHPVIDIAAETLVRGYKIRMNIDGEFEHFNVTLSSDPPLKEMDILTLLAVGQKSAELKGLEGGVGAGEATSFLTGKVQDVMEERMKSITGLDRFQVDPYVSKSTGTVTPRVTVSKRLVGDKVFVTYATGVSLKEEQIIKLEYFIDKNISLVGVRDERGIIGGDVRFRFEFK